VLLIVVGLPQLSADVLASQVVANPEWRGRPAAGVRLWRIRIDGIAASETAIPERTPARAHRGWGHRDA
jgi:hypothetical protein